MANRDEGYDYRSDHRVVRDEGTIPRKKTNNAFHIEDLPSDAETYDEDERQEMEDDRRRSLSSGHIKAGTEDGDRMLDDDIEHMSEDELLAIGVTNKERYLTERDAYLHNYRYTLVPEIPEQFRGTDILGLRTRTTGSSSIPIGPITPKRKLRTIWNCLTDVERYILMLISEHRHMTANQLMPFIVLPSVLKLGASPNGDSAPTFDSTRTYYEYLTQDKYSYPLSYKETFKTSGMKGLEGKLGHLADLKLIEEIVPSYKVSDRATRQYGETPSLFTSHYYLTPLGAKVLVCNTSAEVPSKSGSNSRRTVGYVDTYRNAAYISIVHETECNEIMCSLAECAMYMSNLAAFGYDGEDDPEDVQDELGTLDVCRFFHERECEYKDIPYRESGTNKERTIDFKCDGEMTMYSSGFGEFIDYYLEYDSGTSTADKITHKVEAFARFVAYKRREYKDRFRLPVLLLVSQQPSAFMPDIHLKASGRYITGIKKLAERKLADAFPDGMNGTVIVLVADVRMIREHGALGAVWHRVDLDAGSVEPTALDLLEASKPAVQGR